MSLPRRSYYYMPKNRSSHGAMEARMGDICLEFPRYGYRRVTKELQREVWIVNHKKVARIMSEKGWSCRPREKKWVTTVHSDHGLQIHPNLIKGLTLTDFNQLWLADITYGSSPASPTWP